MNNFLYGLATGVIIGSCTATFTLSRMLRKWMGTLR